MTLHSGDSSRQHEGGCCSVNHEVYSAGDLAIQGWQIPLSPIEYGISHNCITLNSETHAVDLT